MPRRLVDPTTWARTGRGHATDIVGIDEKDISGVLSMGNTDWPTLVLLNVDRVKVDRGFAEVLVEVAYEEMPALAQEGRWDFFVWVPEWTPELAPMVSGDASQRRAAAIASLSGLVNVQYGRRRGAAVEPVTVGCVGSVRSVDGEERNYEEYVLLWKAIVRALRQRTS